MDERHSRQDRPWAGEALWQGHPTVSRAVQVTLDGERFEAVGHAGGRRAFGVWGRLEQLRRFTRQMEREGARVLGLPARAEAGGPPSGRPAGRGPIETQVKEPPPGEEQPPPPPTGSTKLSTSGAQLLLAHSGGGAPVLPSGLDLAAVSAIPELEQRLPLPTYLGYPYGDANSLPRQRWSVIVPRGAPGEELLKAIQPLIDLRAQQQEAAVKPYQVGPLGSVRAADDWIRGTYLSENVPEHERPRYLLILGDFGDVSPELQQRLGAHAFVGRLCFDTPAGYRAYAEKVVRLEKDPPRQDARALFYTAHDGSEATSIGYEALVTPALELCDDIPRRTYPVREVLEVGSKDDWSSQRLLEAVREGGPNVLFTLSHGLGPPPEGWTPEQRRLLQGAMVLGKGEAPLTGERVATGPFLTGGAWFYLACFGAGTPARSVYRPWLEQLRKAGEYAGPVQRVLDVLPEEGERPFVAALPRAALANPEGPLAIIGHLDLAWTYGFVDARGARRPSRFVEVMKQLWTGRRVGVAARVLKDQASSVESELLGLAQSDAELAPGQQPPPEAVHRGHLWMSLHDLAGYLLLGDPAAQVVPGRG